MPSLDIDVSCVGACIRINEVLKFELKKNLLDCFITKVTLLDPDAVAREGGVAHGCECVVGEVAQ